MTKPSSRPWRIEPEGKLSDSVDDEAMLKAPEDRSGEVRVSYCAEDCRKRVEEMAYGLKAGEEVEDLGRNGCRIIQKKDGFRFGTDAVLLSWFAAKRLKPGACVVDLCTGTGIVPLLLDARRQDTGDRYTGIEIQEDMADMAKRSVLLNSREDRIRIEEGDVRRASEVYGKHRFDAVTCNPPYIKAGSGLLNPDSKKAVSRHEILCTLEDVIREGSALLKMDGRFFMVHRPFRLQEIMEGFSRYRLGAASLMMVHPEEEKEASLLLIEGIRGRTCETRILPPLVLYRKDGSPSENLKKIYEA